MLQKDHPLHTGTARRRRPARPYSTRKVVNQIYTLSSRQRYSIIRHLPCKVYRVGRKGEGDEQMGGARGAKAHSPSLLPAYIGYPYRTGKNYKPAKIVSKDKNWGIQISELIPDRHRNEGLAPRWPHHCYKNGFPLSYTSQRRYSDSFNPMAETVKDCCLDLKRGYSAKKDKKLNVGC